MDAMVNNDYLEVVFEIKPLAAMSQQTGKDILIAALGAVGFESFVETDQGVTAYIQEIEYHEDMLIEVAFLNTDDFEIKCHTEVIAQVNWNEEWEKNFDPIMVDDKCSVRAPFHDKPDTLFDIVIVPKMSFGTGHHETTHMMLQHILQHDMQGKKVLDMGCGTGVLAILATMRGASPTDAIDIDNWCYLNTLENIKRNQCDAISVYEGDAKLLSDAHYDVILANINRNILLKDMVVYARCLSKGGDLFLSGFYKEDLEMITEACQKNGLHFVGNLEINNWISSHYRHVIEKK